MGAVLAALFNDHETAERVRTRLVVDGFPTDRVELTSPREPGQAELVPAAGLRDKLVKYFATILDREDERDLATSLTEEIIRSGAATIVVHPRGQIETTRALEILHEAGPREVHEHDLENQTLEHAAAATDEPPVIANILPGAKGG